MLKQIEGISPMRKNLATPDKLLNTITIEDLINKKAKNHNRSSNSTGGY
jgi:hypothetical protein